MSVKSGDQKSVCLQPLNLMMKQSPEMTLFTITDHVLINVKEPERGIRMTIKMKRKILSEMMTTYFPSLLLMMITYATTFFKPFFFEAALSVNLTTMLVMTTIFISKMEGLPPTSDIKMIDIWLILCQLVPFAQVVLLTSMEYLRDEKEEGKKQEGDQQVARGKENGPDEKGVELDVADEIKPQEAWVPMDKNTVKDNKITKLLIIGRLV